MGFYKTGLFNSVRVVIASIILSTILGIIIGVLRLSRNKLLSNLAKAYVDLFRNLPLILQLLLILVWFVTTLEPFREVQENNLLEWIYWSNRGFVFPKVVIQNMTYFLVGLGILLSFRVYLRYVERISLEVENSDVSSTSRDTLSQFKEKINSLILRPFNFLDRKLEPVIPDVLFLFSVLSFTFGIFRILEWNYSFSVGGIFDREPYSLFCIQSNHVILQFENVCLTRAGRAQFFYRKLQPRCN